MIMKLLLGLILRITANFLVRIEGNLFYLKWDIDIPLFARYKLDHSCDHYAIYTLSKEPDKKFTSSLRQNVEDSVLHKFRYERETELSAITNC